MTDSKSVLLALALGLGGMLLLWVHHFRYGWRGPSKWGARLPKGSFGWPVIGESIAFITNPPKFASSHIKRYGTLFKTNLFLQPSVVGTTPEFAKFVLSNSHLFLSGYPAIMQFLGPKALLFRDGAPHTAAKKLVLKAIRSDTLRSQVHAVESIILQNLSSWEQKGTVVGRDVTQLITIQTAFWFLIRANDIRSTPEGRKALQDFILVNTGILSFPVDLPGTNYRRGLKAKADLQAFLKLLLQQRKGQENPENDIMGALLSAHDNEEVQEQLKDFDDDWIVDNSMIILFGAYESTAMTLTWVLKLLIDHPDVFRRIQAEHQEILKDKDPSVEGPRLNWEDIRKMEYTSRFVQEMQRIVSIAPLVTRKAAQDVEYEGHLIPKGWGVFPIFNTMHSDPALFPDPQTFNPDRFKVAPKPFSYMPFGSGVHMCPGLEIVKLVVLIFTHHLATTFSYESAGPDRGVDYRNLGALPVGGYPIKIRRATKSS